MLLKILTILCGIGVATLAGYILFGDELAGLYAGAATEQAVAPEKPGVTVLVKQPGRRHSALPVLTAPAGQGAGSVSGYAIDLGGASSFGALSARFAEIARLNAEVDFDRLEPRTILRDTLDGVEARLLVGPFKTVKEAEAVCENIALPARVNCQAVRFAGELIARQ